MGYGDYQCMDENGIREDGRKADEMRPVEIVTAKNNLLADF